MSCYHPSRVPVRRKSIFAGQRLHYTQVVPCGSCLGCRSEQGRQWAVRIMHEARKHTESYFVTLTYSQEELPDNGGLRPRDFSRFVKDLRKEQPESAISFFGCGEYGEERGRPHYHAVLFGAHFLDMHRHPDRSRGDVWQSPSLDDVWGRGLAEFGTVTMGSASYVAGYVRKKVRGSQVTRVNPLTGELLEPEFARMSLRPAIGKRWIQDHWMDVYPRDFVVVDGIEAKPPRYYDKWMDENLPFVMENVRQRRYDEAVELTKYQLQAGEKIHEARVSLFQRRDKLC